MCLAVLASRATTPTERIEYLFINSPCEALSGVETGARALMVYNFNEKNGEKTPTNLGTADAVMLELEPQHIALRTSEKGITELQLLIARRDTTLAVIETVETPLRDSRITFYDTQWRPKAAPKAFRMPTIKDFIKKGTPKDVAREIEDTVAFMFTELTFEQGKVIAKQALTKHYADLRKHEQWLVESVQCKLK